MTHWGVLPLSSVRYFGTMCEQTLPQTQGGGGAERFVKVCEMSRSQQNKTCRSAPAPSHRHLSEDSCTCPHLKEDTWALCQDLLEQNTDQLKTSSCSSAECRTHTSCLHHLLLLCDRKVDSMKTVGGVKTAAPPSAAEKPHQFWMLQEEGHEVTGGAMK